MQVVFLGKFSRDLDDLTDSGLKASVMDVIQSLERAASLAEIANVRKMTGFKTAFRIRIRDYRLGVYYENGVVELVRFLHRSKIYRTFP